MLRDEQAHLEAQKRLLNESYNPVENSDEILDENPNQIIMPSVPL